MTVFWTAPSVARAFAALLRADESLAGVPVWNAHPGDDLPAEAIVLLRIEGDQEWAALGRRSRDETFSIRVSVFVVQSGVDNDAIDTAQQRVEALVNKVAAIVHGDPTLGGAARVAAFKGAGLDNGANANSRWSEGTFEIACTVRITD